MCLHVYIPQTRPNTPFCSVPVSVCPHPSVPDPCAQYGWDQHSWSNFTRPSEDIGLTPLQHLDPDSQTTTTPLPQPFCHSSSPWCFQVHSHRIPTTIRRVEGGSGEMLAVQDWQRRVTLAVCFWALTPCRCCPVLVHTDAIVPYALMDSLCVAFWNSQSQQIQRREEFPWQQLVYADWTPSSDNLLHFWTDRAVGLQITESFLSWNFRLLLCNSVAAKKDTFSVSNPFPPLLAMILFLFVQSLTFTLVEE